MNTFQELVPEFNNGLLLSAAPVIESVIDDALEYALLNDDASQFYTYLLKSQFYRMNGELDNAQSQLAIASDYAIDDEEFELLDRLNCFLNAESTFLSTGVAFDIDDLTDSGCGTIQAIGASGGNNTEIVEAVERFSMSIYPNPANDLISISILSLEDGSLNEIQNVVLYDLKGRILLNRSVSLSTSIIELNLNELSTGLYIAVGFMEDGNFAKKYFFKN